MQFLGLSEPSIGNVLDMSGLRFMSKIFGQADIGKTSGKSQ